MFLVGLAMQTCAAAGQARSPGERALQTKAEAIAGGHHGKVTLFAKDLDSGRTVEIMPDRPVATASVIKLPILFEALEQIRSGKAKFDDRLTLRKQDQVAGSGVLLFLDTPATVTLKDALSMMIVMSDNTATNLVIDHLGISNINARIQWMGLRDTYLYKKVFVPATDELPASLQQEQKVFGLGKTTAREMAAVMERIYSCQLAGKEDTATPADESLCEAALHMLGNQFYRDAIPRYLDGWSAAGTGSGVAIGNKSGALDQVRNDVALIASRHGPIVISAFTFENKDQSWQADNEGELTIAKLAKAIVEEWSPEGLAPDQFKTRPAGKHAAR